MTAFWWSPTAYDDDEPGGSATGPVPLAERRVVRFDPTSLDLSPGRRLRVFAALVCGSPGGITFTGMGHTRVPFLAPSRPISYRQLLRAIEKSPRFTMLHHELSELPLRIGDCSKMFTTIPEEYQHNRRDPDLHPALQDLGDEINEDIREALAALDDPHHYYPGIDEGIEPVSDEHVELVTWALQRELNRELRTGGGFYGSTAVLPAAPLAALPWDVKRALAERRRWRYKQWGLGKDQWKRGSWSLWEVPDDPEYVPRRSQRLLAA